MAFFSNIETFRLLGRYYKLTLSGTLHGGAFELLDQSGAPVCSGTWVSDGTERGVKDVRWLQSTREVPMTSLVGYVTDQLPRFSRPG
jgi:hypothetical protein